MSTESGLTWVPRRRKYEAERKATAKHSEPCNQDPLKAGKIESKPVEQQQQQQQQKDRRSGSNTQPVFVDPLNQPLGPPAASETAFSLSKMVADVSFKEKVLVCQVLNLKISHLIAIRSV